MATTNPVKFADLTEAFKPGNIQKIYPEPLKKFPTDPTQNTAQCLITYNLTTYKAPELGMWGIYESHPCDSLTNAEKRQEQRLKSFDKYNEEHGENSSYKYVAFVISKTTTYIDIVGVAQETYQISHKVVDYTKKQPTNKVFINGPLKDNEFLKKKGKHYA